MAETTHTEVGAEAPAKREFPPFDPTTFVPQLFWLAVTFTLLYVVLERISLPGIARVIDARQKRIADDLDAAERLRKDAESALTAYEKTLAEARARAGEITAQARAAIKAEADKQRAQVDADLASRIEAAERDIAAAKQAAMADVRGLAVDVAGAIVEKILQQRPGRSELAHAVDAELVA